MKSHPLGLNVVYEVYNKGKLRYSSNSKHSHDAEIEVRINNPNCKEQVIRFPFRSYVSNFSRVLNNAFLNIDNSTSGEGINKIIKTDIGGATYPASAIHTMAVNEGLLSGGAQTDFGIWIGDVYNQNSMGLTVDSIVNEPVQYNNHRLRTLILADGGTPDTNVSYGATNVLLSNGDDTLTVKRRFTNNNPTQILISEIGMVAKSGSDYFLIARDSPNLTENGHFTLLANGTCEVSYIFNITALSGWTRNYLRMLSSEFVANNALSAPKDIDNTAFTTNFSTARTQKDLLAAVNNANYGIGVGATIELAEYPSYNTLSEEIIDKVSEGSDRMQLVHSAVVPIALEQASSKTTFGLQRDFERVNQIGKMYVHSSGLLIRQGTNPYKYFLIAHDYIPSQNQKLEILPGEILRVKYYFEAGL